MQKTLLETNKTRGYIKNKKLIKSKVRNFKCLRMLLPVTTWRIILNGHYDTLHILFYTFQSKYYVDMTTFHVHNCHISDAPHTISNRE